MVRIRKIIKNSNRVFKTCIKTISQCEVKSMMKKQTNHLSKKNSMGSIRNVVFLNAAFHWIFFFKLHMTLTANIYGLNHLNHLCVILEFRILVVGLGSPSRAAMVSGNKVYSHLCSKSSACPGALMPFADPMISADNASSAPFSSQSARQSELCEQADESWRAQRRRLPPPRCVISIPSFNPPIREWLQWLGYYRFHDALLTCTFRLFYPRNV